LDWHGNRVSTVLPTYPAEIAEQPCPFLDERTMEQAGFKRPEQFRDR